MFSLWFKLNKLMFWLCLKLTTAPDWALILIRANSRSSTNWTNKTYSQSVYCVHNVLFELTTRTVSQTVYVRCSQCTVWTSPQRVYCVHNVLFELVLVQSDSVLCSHNTVWTSPPSSSEKVYCAHNVLFELAHVQSTVFTMYCLN